MIMPTLINCEEELVVLVDRKQRGRNVAVHHAHIHDLPRRCAPGMRRPPELPKATGFLLVMRRRRTRAARGRMSARLGSLERVGRARPHLRSLQLEESARQSVRGPSSATPSRTAKRVSSAVLFNCSVARKRSRC
jgi:hypothetical protein